MASVVIPWYGDVGEVGSPTPGWWRRAALYHVAAWWKTTFPAWPVVVARQPDTGPWRKAMAIHDGLADTTESTIVVADADVTMCWRPDDIATAVVQVASGSRPWAIPHGTVHRLTQDATTLALRHGIYPEPGRRRNPSFLESYRGVPGGGIVVVSRTLIQEIPPDPRFVGWGQEDQAWARALTTLTGFPWRGRSPLYHLWHPPQRRLSRGVGSAEGLALWRRYRDAATRPAMEAMVREAREAFDLLG